MNANDLHTLSSKAIDRGALSQSCSRPHSHSFSRPRSLTRHAILAASLAMVWGCTVTTTSSGTDAGPGGDDAATPPTDDASTPTPGADAGTDAAPPTGDATVGVLGFTPSNGVEAALAGVDLSMLGDIDVTNADEQVGVDCNSAGATACIAKAVTQSDGSTVEVYVAKSWKIEPAGALNVVDKTPIVLVATGTITVLGRISAHATAMETVAGGFTGTDDGTAGGPGQGVAGLAYTSGVSTGIPGGGGSFCGAGGAAGKATAANGAAGKTYGTPTLVPLVAGSAGGHASLFAGAGGGAVQLVAGTSITIGAGGILSLGGGGGYDGTDTGSYGASGGGSGGAALLEAPTVTVAGTIAANGGGGGGGAGGPTVAPDATDNATAALGGQSGMTGAGGTGSAGATVTGAAGGAGDALNGAYSPGAGGGGAGYIRINTTTGVATLGGTVSPAAGTTCMSQGTLAH